MKIWIRGTFNNTRTAVGFAENRLLFHNIPDVVSPGFTKQKVTLVASYWFGVEDVGDIWTMRLAVVHESFPTLTESTPGDGDNSVRGMYPFSKGPVAYQPRGLISVPPDTKLWLTTIKKVGSAASTLQGYYSLLFNITGI